VIERDRPRRNRTSRPHFLGFDVGRESVRAGIVDPFGSLKIVANCRIPLWTTAPGHEEQSSGAIWKACCVAARDAISQSKLAAADISGIGFSAVGSLVALDIHQRPVTLSTSGRSEMNVISSADTRATVEAQEISLSLHQVLRRSGQTSDARMQIPRLLWLKRNLPDSWKRITTFFELVDFLSFRATREMTRSLCTAVSRWNYVCCQKGDAAGWETTYFRQIELGDLVREGFEKIGRVIRPPGQPIGMGTTDTASEELGVLPGTPVGVGASRSQAHGLGLIGMRTRDLAPSKAEIERRLVVSDVSSLNFLTFSTRPRFVTGTLGPFYSALIPSMWVTEGYRSYWQPDTTAALERESRSVEIHAEREGAEVSEFHDISPMGKRARDIFGREVAMNSGDDRNWRSISPIAAMSCPIQLPTTKVVVKLFVEETRSFAHKVYREVKRWNDKGCRIDTLLVDGTIQNKTFLRELGAIAGCRILVPKVPDATLQGSAILGAVASGHYSSISVALRCMSPEGDVVFPSNDLGAVSSANRKSYIGKQ
jgi:ribulose kinase